MATSEKSLQLTTEVNEKALATIVTDCPYKSINEAIEAKLPSLRKVEMSLGQKAASRLVAVSIFEIKKVLSFDISTEMIIAASDVISQKFYDISSADLGIFKKMVIANELGGTLYRLDARGLVELFEKYYAEREYELEQLRQRRSDEWRHIEPGDLEKTFKTLERMRAEAKKPKPKSNTRIDPSDVAKKEAWQECVHEFSEKNGYAECSKCGSVIYPK